MVGSLFNTPSTTTAILFANQTGPLISKHIYGHFAEHLGRCIYDGIYVGLRSHLKNTNGLRTDVIEALKKINIPNLRWPGGCFADTYHWKDGIGPVENRPTLVNTHWGAITEDNSFGTHNFLELCEILQTEPYITGNIASGTVQELSDWVQYVNFQGAGPMSDLRRTNGRSQAWKVKYWGLGNEAWGCGGNMTAESYANEYRKFSSFLYNYTDDFRIFRIASGANSEDYNWTEVLMKNIPNYLFEGISLHHYTTIDWHNKGSATDFTEQEYVLCLKKAFYMEELLSRHGAIMDRYDPDKKIALVVDEWGSWYNVEKGTHPGFLYQQNTMRDAIIAAVSLNIFNQFSQRVHMANLAQAVNVLQALILTDNENLVLTPTYHIMNMYKVHQEARLIDFKIDSENYTINENTIPAISGSASLDKNDFLHLSLVNVHGSKTIFVAIQIQGRIINSITAKILTSHNLQDHNDFDQPEKILPGVFYDFLLVENCLQIKMPSFSALIFEIK
ncbi:MAG: alpha-L-arabinofuranosidase AbfB [Flavisolibacter sp.]